MNRLTRDEIIGRALDQIDSPALNQRERPGGVLQANAMSITWLGECLSYMHNRFPWAAGITSTSYTLTPGIVTYALPADFILDVRDGLRIMQTDVKRRLRRKKLQWLLSKNTLDSTGVPSGYVILPPNLQVWQIPDKSYTAEMWYYAMPQKLAADDVPSFPDDWVLVKYVTVAGKEFTGEQPPGAAMQFAISAANGLRQAGLGSEPEEDNTALDPSFFAPTGAEPGFTSAWMGDVGNQP